jgi:hypothetical protein
MNNFELIINIIVIILLILTILYIWRLNRNITILRNNHDSLSTLAQSLNEAAIKAENAVISLKAAAHETSRNIHNLVEEAEQSALVTSDEDEQPKSEAELELIKALRALR